MADRTRWVGRPRSRWTLALAAIAATAALSACGSGNKTATGTTTRTTAAPPTTTAATTTATTAPAATTTTVAPTTSAPASTSTSTSSTSIGSSTSSSGGSVDGAEIDQLPTVPDPTTTPARPDLSTVTGQSTFLRQTFADIQSVWKENFDSAGLGYSPAQLVLFQSAVQTACGVESANVGPFYCPGDHTVYLDIRFFSSLETQFGVSGDFAEAYVVAHEMGHYVQNLVGISQRVAAADQADPSGANALSVQVELQADCLAGVWAHSTYERNLLEPGDIEEALQAAQTVGDDFLENAQGATVDPDSWTHGSSAQRQQWFTTGYEQGKADACDTFGA